MLLSTLRNTQKLARIRVLVGHVPFLGLVLCPPSELEVWEQLDDLLCGLCPQQRKEEDTRLTFQLASRKAVMPPIPSGYLAELLPKFSRIGNCQEVEF